LTFVGRVKKLGDRHKFITYSDFIEHRYDAKTRLMSTFTMVIAYIGYIASQLVAGAYIISSITGLSLDFCFLVATSITVIYTSMGGFHAVEKTDRFQTLLVLLGLTFIAVPLTAHSIGGFERLATDLPESYFDWGGWGWGTITALFTGTALTFYTSMDSYTRIYAAKSPSSARWGTFFAAFVALTISCSICFLGMSAHVLFPEGVGGASALVALILKVLPVGVKGLMLVAILAVVMSTADTCILCASANFTRDVYQRFINPEAPQKKLVRIGIISSVVMGVTGALIGRYMADIMTILIMAYTVNSAGLFIPTIGVFWKRSNAKAAFWSMCLSLVTVVVWYVGQAVVPDSALFAINPVWPGLLVSIGVFFPMSFFTEDAAAKERIKAVAGKPQVQNPSETHA
jgi:SSS family solute:Na+ symporter